MIRAIHLGKYGRRPGRDVVCPTCRSGIGQPCRLTRGKHAGEKAHEIHPRRRHLSERKRCAHAQRAVRRGRRGLTIYCLACRSVVPLFRLQECAAPWAQAA